MILEQFYKEYPQQTIKINGQDFVYRYYQNESAKETLVLLTGGIGLSDLFYNHFDRFAKDFSVITFDYLMCYPTMNELTDAMAELFKTLGIKVWLVGQSLGGATAQIMAKRHPECVEGIVLSNTSSLQNWGGSAEYFEGMKKRQTKSLRMMKFMPFGIVKKVMMKAINLKVAKLPEEHREEFGQLADVMLEMLTKKYEIHMTKMLLDCGNHLGMEKKDFAFLDNKVLLILAEDDETFTAEVRQQLIDIMTNPTEVKDMDGGHLGAIMDVENYAVTVVDYIKGRV